MKLKTKLKIKYALRTQAELFRHPLMSFRVKGKEVNMYQFIYVGWKAIDAIVQE